MPKYFTLFSLLLFTLSCGHGYDSFPAKLTVLESEPANVLFAPGMELNFSGSSLTVAMKDNKEEYNFLWVGDRLAVRSDFSDWLFKTESGSGDTLYLHEKYAEHPMKIKLIKNNKSKKNRS